MQQNITDKLLNFLLPKFCVHCGRFGHYLCQSCYDQIDFIDNHYCPYCRKPALDGFTHSRCSGPRKIDGIISATAYQNSIRSLIKKLKYPPYSQQVFEEIDLILRRYFTDQEILFPPTAVLIPIPLHPNKLQVRGFNQAELIAQALKEIWGLEMNNNILLREKEGHDQTSLLRSERLDNVHGLYVINPEFRNQIKNGSFILVDDVVTTGATLKKCAHILKINQAKKVWAITVARD